MRSSNIVTLTPKQAAELANSELFKYKTVSAKKAYMTRLIAAQREFTDYITHAVNHGNGWYMGEQYNRFDLMREETILLRYKIIRADL